jgi:hypothetical protein
MEEEMSASILGATPWGIKEIELALERHGYEAVYQALREHPGSRIVEVLASIATTRKVFVRSSNSIRRCVEEFHHGTMDGIHRRENVDKLQEIEIRIQEGLYLFVCGAMSLVDQCRNASKLVDIPHYSEIVLKTFATNPEHRFIQGLRNDLSHVSFKSSAWRVSDGVGGRTTQFLIQPAALHLDEYPADGRKYAKIHPEGIDLIRLVDAYESRVSQFQDWFGSALRDASANPISEFEMGDRSLRGLGAKVSWRILFQFVGPGKRDPYAYLDQYLFEHELIDVLALPHRSKMQVDQIIEFLDDYDICDDELRSQIYAIFAVES